MTQIVLHRPAVVTQQRALMGWPWVWWEARIYPDADGTLYKQQVEDFLDPRSEYSMTFGPDGDGVVLRDPPAVHILCVQDCLDDVPFGDRDLFRAHSGPRFMTVRVVWHEPPGRLQNSSGLQVKSAWQALGSRTCIPGDYRVENVDTRQHQPLNDAWRGPMYPSPYPPLEWPQTPTIRDGTEVAPNRTGYAPPNEAELWSISRAGHQPVPLVTARHRKKPKPPVEPIPTTGTRNIDGINDDGIIAKIDALIDDELADGEYAREEVRRAGLPGITD